MWDYSLGTSSALSSSSLGCRADNAAFILSTAVGKIVIPTRNSQHSEPVNRLKSCGSGNSHRCYLTNTNVCSAGLEKSRLKPWAILPFRKAPVQFSIWHLLAVLFCLLRERNTFFPCCMLAVFKVFSLAIPGSSQAGFLEVSQGADSLLAVAGAHCPQAFLFTMAESPGPWHPDSTFYHLQEPQDPRDLHALCQGVPRENLGCFPFIATSLLDFQLPSLSAFHFLPLCSPLPSPQSDPRLSFEVGESQESSPRHLCRSWSLQSQALKHTPRAANDPAASLEQSCWESPALRAVIAQGHGRN